MTDEAYIRPRATFNGPKCLGLADGALARVSVGRFPQNVDFVGAGLDAARPRQPPDETTEF